MCATFSTSQHECVITWDWTARKPETQQPLVQPRSLKLVWTSSGHQSQGRRRSTFWQAMMTQIGNPRAAMLLVHFQSQAEASIPGRRIELCRMLARTSHGTGSLQDQLIQAVMVARLPACLWVRE